MLTEVLHNSKIVMYVNGENLSLPDRELQKPSAKKKACMTNLWDWKNKYLSKNIALKS